MYNVNFIKLEYKNIYFAGLPHLDAVHFSAAVIDNVPLLSLDTLHGVAGDLTCGSYPYQGIPADLAMSALRMRTWISQQKDE